MVKKFKVLQIGSTDNLQTDETIWRYVSEEEVLEEQEEMQFQLEKEGPYDFIYVKVPYSNKLMKLLEVLSEPYTTYVDQRYWDKAFRTHDLTRKYCMLCFEYQNEDERLEKLKAVTFPGQYGDKVQLIHCKLTRYFDGTVHYEGNEALMISGDFGDNMAPFLSWKQHLGYDKDKVIQVWPEYTVSDEVEIMFVYRLAPTNESHTVKETFVRKQDELITPLEIPRQPHDAHILISMYAKGKGTIRVGAVHKRWSRLDLGQFILGGKRYADSNRDEFIYYFNPGDMQPPLNVYFSGYRSAEGFEGFYMMKKLNAPFMLIGDPRLEGGAFYLGSEEYEQAIKQVIEEKLEALGFQRNELILSGLSMGSFGALYYGAQLNPAAIVVGKPLINLGTIAENMALVRPEDFGTSLDVLYKNEKGLTSASIQQLNDKFWQQFSQADWSHTTFAISYMAHDDYDKHAFEMMLPILSRQQARVMQRGVPGRHNDDTPTITSWFVNFYHMILESQYGRGRKDAE
ncbi:accessory Sec system protein Asp2 [Staphylococcus americanisciuri]|uniref:Accessory Sec system protein Asp2 n=1 Tax=Staphylococcus americanisciuri TaxID=2973940 RepID=A0ABT2F4F8_9STAP|nr:accessory Sec system protein Asp2 [Staphylococcus americanisciuri]MCS4487341.1 accessory Sec system protein Asp2 [Staphylococcus americanisciuri]